MYALSVSANLYTFHDSFTNMNKSISSKNSVSVAVETTMDKQIYKFTQASYAYTKQDFLENPCLK